jgi:hypothetical protein
VEVVLVKNRPQAVPGCLLEERHRLDLVRHRASPPLSFR